MNWCLLYSLPVQAGNCELAVLVFDPSSMESLNYVTSLQVPPNALGTGYSRVYHPSEGCWEGVGDFCSSNGWIENCGLGEVASLTVACGHE